MGSFLCGARSTIVVQKQLEVKKNLTYIVTAVTQPTQEA